jgi:cytochrome c-type biogenesis protein CcmE
MNAGTVRKFIIAVIVIGAASVYLLYQTGESSWVYYYTVDEFVESESGKPLQGSDTQPPQTIRNGVIRLAGRVKADSIVHNAQKMQLDFELIGQNKSVVVRFSGVAPKNFSADRDVVVEGRISADGTFEARKILTRCESKYRVKLNPDLADK